MLEASQDVDSLKARIAELEAALKVSKSKECDNNWAALKEEYGPLIGRHFMCNGERWKFFGLVHGDDDYYYGLIKVVKPEQQTRLMLATCVGDLATQGFTLVTSE